MRNLTLAATQFACSWDARANIDKAKALARAAAKAGANAILIQELFETPYFCQDQLVDHFKLAAPAEGNPLIAEMSDLARELGVVLPVSFFERAGRAHFNSLAMVEATDACSASIASRTSRRAGLSGEVLFHAGRYRLQGVADEIRHDGRRHLLDQWFPESARAMALMGAEVLFYPTAIGSEPPPAPPVDSRDHWRRTMQGHAAANMAPLVASNRIGTENGSAGEMTFYGSSFIADPTGGIVAELGRAEEGFVTASFDLDAVHQARTSWGLFRDRRPELRRDRPHHG